MARICIVDDDFDYCEELEFALGRDGHEVITAQTGLEAIERGSLFRPEVLVTDWMLKGHIHGLNISDALSLVYPQMRTILITGFASGDLQSDAEVSGVIEFVEKPFHLGHIRRAVQQALTMEMHNLEDVPIGVVEVDERNSIVYANRAACSYLGLKMEHGAVITDPQGYLREWLLRKAVGAWCDLEAAQPLKIIGRVFPDVESRLFVIVSAQHQSVQNDERIQLLIGNRIPPHFSAELDGHVLVVDDHIEVRKVSARVFRVCSCFCHTAETHEEAQKLLLRDQQIKYVILDYDMPGITAGDFVRKLRALRPDIKIIGTSAVDVREKFAPLGVSNFLAKPWNVEELLRSCVQAS